MQKAQAKARAKGIEAEQPRVWSMPGLKRPSGMRDDSDVTDEGETGMSLRHSAAARTAAERGTADHLIQINE